MNPNLGQFRATLHGVWAALPTPWTTDGRIDAGIVGELIARYKAAGVHGAYTTGTDGEMHVLDIEDFQGLVDAFADGVEVSWLPAQVGCTWSHTDGVVERARYAQERGIDCIQAALPSWVPLSDVELLSFFTALQAATPDLGVVHYNIARTGRFLTGTDYRAILEVAPNLLGSKHTGGDVGSLIEIVGATPELHHFVVDMQVVPGALFGAKGFYSFLANLNPRYAVELWQDCVRGDWPEAARKAVLVSAFFRDWRASRPGVSASPALAKLATAAGILPEMPLAVRAPYQAGTEAALASLRALLKERYPALVYEP